MNREFVLRDNEIAINRPDGTVIIMNLNAFQELHNRLDTEAKNNKTKLEAANNLIVALQKHLAEVKMKNQEVVNLYNNQLERTNDINAKLNETLAALDEKTKQVNQLQAEVENAKKAAKNSATDKDKMHLVLWGSTNFPKVVPDFVYVTSKGEIFFSGAEIERKYNLPKGSVSAYLADKQKFLYPRDRNGVHAVDEVRGDIERLAVVRRFTNSMFKNMDLNNPDYSFISGAIQTAKMYESGELPS